jgi:PKD repeat protein
MKKLSLSILMLLLVFNVKAQFFCPFTYSSNPGTNIVSFQPDSAYSPNLYHFVWDLGDGTTDSTYSPTHIYNTPLPVYACCYIYDTANVLRCSSCDSVGYNITPPACTFSIIPTSAPNVIIGQAQAIPNSFTQWDMGDGGTVVGNTITYTYSQPGLYFVCLTESDPATGAIICSSCQPVNIIPFPPSCSFTYNSIPGSNTFTFASNASGSNILWDFGDSTSLTGSNQVTHTFPAPGLYNVCIYVTDSVGTTICTYCDFVSVGNTQGNCLFSFGPSLLLPNTFDFYAQPGSNTSNISWDFGDGSVDTGLNISHSYNSPGLYLVCMSEIDAVTNTVICSSCFPVQVNSNINCNFTSFVNPQNNLFVNFQANVPGPNYSITWDFGDNTSGTGANPSHTYTNAGTYLVCVTIGVNGAVVCSSCNWVIVGSNSGPCVINFFPDSLIQNSFYFSFQQSTPSSQIVWDFGDGNMGTGSFINHFYNAPGIYMVCVIERDSAGTVTLCQTCITVFVGPGPSVCQASFLSTSLGLTGYFIDLSISNINNTSYFWDFGDNTTSTTRFPQHTYSAPGTYNVCLTITSGNCTDQFCSPILVDTIINPSGGCQAFFAIVQLAPFQVSVVNLSSGVNLGFNWDYGDGFVDSLPFPSHYYSTTGVYNLCLTVSDANGCSSAYCDSITVDSLGYIYRGMAGFSLNVYSPMQITASVNEIKTAQSFKAYPNPVTSDLHINSTSVNERTVGYRILSNLGSEVLSGKLSGTEAIVNLQKLAQGSYLLEVLFSDGSRSYQNIIKN